MGASTGRGRRVRGAARRGGRRQGKTADRERARSLARRLAAAYPDAWCSLVFRSPWELLVATVLSAQSTDAQVNRVTPGLFAEFPTPEALAAAPRSRVEALIRQIGVFRRKAAALQAMARQVHGRHGGAVPRSLDALTQLEGVGRKTANVVLGTACGRPAISVDTHVARLARRMGLSHEADPAKIEWDIASLLPASEWTRFCHRMIHHGRQVCSARRPRCTACSVATLCPKIGLL